MPFIISPVSLGDISHLAAIQWAALENNPLIQACYPHGPTATLAAFTTASYEKASRYPSVRLIKATDDASGEIVAFAKWVVYLQEQREKSAGGGEERADQTAWGWRREEMRAVPPDCDQRVLAEWNGSLTKMRRRIMGGRGHVLLDICHTDPKHQGRGAGAQLVKWGTDLADNEGLQCYLEASPGGHGLYRKCGFEDSTEMKINLGKYIKGYGEYKHIVMIRPPKGDSDWRPPRPPKKPPLPALQPPQWNEKEEFEPSPVSPEDEVPYTAEARMLDMRESTSSSKRSPGQYMALDRF